MEGFTPKSKTSLTRRCIAEFSLNNFTPSNKGVLDTMSKKYGCMKKDCAEADIQLSNFALFDGEEDYFELSSETTENLKKCSFVKTFKLKTKSKGAASALLINTANPSDLAQMEIQIRGVDTNYSLVTTALGDIEELRDLDPTKPQSVALNILTKDKGIVSLLNPIKPQLEISISYTLIKQ